MVEAASFEAIRDAQDRFVRNQESVMMAHARSGNDVRLDMRKYLDHYEVRYSIKQSSGRTIYRLEHCLFDPAHIRNEAAIIQMDDGTLLYQCFHASCKGHTWMEARKIISGNGSLKPFMDKIISERCYEPQEEMWPDPIPINDYSLLPVFPTEVLPSPGREIVEKVAEVNQVDSGLVASCYVSMLSLALAKKIEVNLITHKEQCNIFSAIIANSGERKTPSLNTMSKPVYEYQASINEELRQAISQSRAEYEILKKRLAKSQDDAARAKDEVDREMIRQEILELTRKIEESKPEHERVYIGDDITPEAMAAVMAAQGERLGIFSAEAGIFNIWAGRYTERSANFDVVLKGHSGDPLFCHRIGREPISMMSPALTLCLCVQPEVIREIGRNRGFRGKGLLARFLYTLCNPRAGHRKRQNTTISPALYDEYCRQIKSLMAIPLPDEPVVLQLDKEAQALWDEFYNEIEFLMRPGHELESLKDWGSKLPGAVARIAGLLHIAKHGHDGIQKSISAVIVGASIAIGAYYKDHALATFGLMGESVEQESAKLILEYLELHKPESFKGRDVLANKSALKTMDQVAAGLKVLVEHGYIRAESSSGVGHGRPPAQSYLTHPTLRDRK